MASDPKFSDWYFTFCKEHNRTPSQEEVWNAALAQPAPVQSNIDAGLDFEPNAQHTVADMANIGYALMQALPAGYAYNDSPAEIVADLQNEIADLKAAPVQAGAQQAAPSDMDQSDLEFALAALHAIAGNEEVVDGCIEKIVDIRRARPRAAEAYRRLARCEQVWAFALAAPTQAGAGDAKGGAVLDVCTDPDNCNRCKTGMRWRGTTPHAGIPVGNSFGGRNG